MLVNATNPSPPLASQPPQLPVRLAAAYLRRYTQHVVVTASPDEVTVNFGQLCTEQPNAPAIEMFASLTLSRAFARQVVELLQQQLRAPGPGRAP